MTNEQILDSYEDQRAVSPADSKEEKEFTCNSLAEYIEHALQKEKNKRRSFRWL